MHNVWQGLQNKLGFYCINIKFKTDFDKAKKDFTKVNQTQGISLFISIQYSTTNWSFIGTYSDSKNDVIFWLIIVYVICVIINHLAYRIFY